MKKLMLTLLLTASLCGLLPQRTKAQSVADCIRQLALDYEKLAGLRDILGQMYRGYEVLSKGYSAVKGVAEGNFNLHEAFLDGLYLVSPAVRKYPPVRDIINDQAALVSEYRQAAGSFSRCGQFGPQDLTYIMQVYNLLISASLHNLDDLAMIITDSLLRMSDYERLTAIDRLYLESHNQLTYLRRFNDQASVIVRQREAVASNRQEMRRLYGIKP